MNWKNALPSRNRSRTHLQRRLHLAFGLLFLLPAAGFILFSARYGILGDEYVSYFFLALMVFAYAGFGILDRLFRRIVTVSEAVSGAPGPADGEHAGAAAEDELHAIVDTFHTLQARFDQAARQLEKKSSDLSALKDLSELCYVTFDPEEILFISLERALLLTGSDLGSVLVLEKADPPVFVVKATIGLGPRVKTGDRLDFETSIAKYAVINKSPLLVENIEKDKRFGRANLCHYGTSSFVCMPIKTSKDVIGVLTISSRDPGRVYSRDEVEVLTPLLSNAAFTFENLRLAWENKRLRSKLQLMEKTVKLMNSSFRDDELMGTVMQEVNSLVAIDAAVILVKDENLSEAVKVWEAFGLSAAPQAKLSEYRFQGTLVEKALQQEPPLIFDIPRERTSPLDRDLFPADVQGCCFVAPLRTGGRVFGALVLTSSSRESLADARDLLAWVAGGLALAIDRRRLQAGVQKRDQEMVTIRQVGSALASSTFDIDKVLNYTMDMVREVLNVEAGSLLFVEGRELEVAVSFNVRLPAVEKFRLNMGQGIAGNVAARGESVIVNDTGASPHFFRGIDDATGFRTRAVLCVPMISQSRVIGVIEVLNKVEGRFNENDRELLQAIAASVCIAIENSRLYKETVAAAEHERNVRRSFQKFVPKEVVDQIIHGVKGSPPVMEELRQVTLLNVDIRGFSRMARQIGPRRTVTLLNRFFAVMGGVVFHHHGIVDKYLGDGFLAVFGAPTALGEHADNALRAAVEMKRSLCRVNGIPGDEPGMPVEMGISIHTGEVLAGSVGFEKKVDYTVIGDAVNTVFRLQAVAKSVPNGILASESTMDAARDRPPSRRVPVPAGFRQELGGLMVYELLDPDEIGRPLRTA